MEQAEKAIDYYTKSIEYHRILQKGNKVSELQKRLEYCREIRKKKERDKVQMKKKLKNRAKKKEQKKKAKKKNKRKK